MRARNFGSLTAALAVAVCGPSDNQPTDIGGSAAAGALASVGNMSASRAAHTATTLADGRVLIVGGLDAAGSSAELFDARTHTFTRTASPGFSRTGHTATKLADGRVLIAGGYNGEYLASTEFYDHTRGVFEPGPAMRAPRSGHVAVPLSDGRVLFVGGVSTGWSFLSSAELFDPRTNRFVATGGMSVPRESHVGVRLADGSVLVVGGHSGRRESIQIYASAERYDPQRGVFVPAGSMTKRRHKHGGIALPDGRVVITGGADERDDQGVYGDAEVYDSATDRFATLGSMQRRRYKHEGTLIPLRDGTILVAGGAETVEVFDPARNAFQLGATTSPLPGSFSAAAALADGSVLITGGYGNGAAARAGAWLFTPRMP
jgi:hypothetical protein